MSWVKIDDQIGRSRKHIAAGPEASWFWVCAIAHCSASLTDGFIDAKLVSLLGDFRNPSRLAERLVDVGLFDRVDGGYRIHDYHDYNRTRAEVLQRRAFDANRKRSTVINSTRNPRGIHTESTRNPSGIRPESVTTPSGHGTEWRGEDNKKEGQAETENRRASAIDAMWQTWRSIMPSTPLTATPKEYQSLCELAETLVSSGGGAGRFEAVAKLFASSPSLQGLRGIGMLRAKWAELCDWLDAHPGVPFGDKAAIKASQEPSWIDTIPSAEQTRRMNAEGRAIAEENRRRYAERKAAAAAAALQS